MENKNFDFEKEYLNAMKDLPNPKLNFQKEDIQFISGAIVLPLIIQMHEAMEKIRTEYQDEYDNIILERFKMLNIEISKLKFELSKLTSFTKQILFSNDFSSEEHYRIYMEEFEKLNKEFMKYYEID